MIGSDALLDSAGPMTRRRRRALEEASGLTPGGCSPLAHAEAGTARTLFSDRTNNIKQVTFPVGDGDSSPVQDWVKASNTGGPGNSTDQNEPPLTPSLGADIQSAMHSPVTDGAFGATPSNTPAHGIDNMLYSSSDEAANFECPEENIVPNLERLPIESSDIRKNEEIWQPEALEKLRSELTKLEIMPQEEPICAGPYPDAPQAMTFPSIAGGNNPGIPQSATPSMVSQQTVNLDVSGRDDILPTPGLFQQPAGTVTRAMNSPATPEDASYKPFSFSKSSGSFFATPEVPIKSGMTPMTSTADSRNAQKHIPAWNRVSRMVSKQYPLVARQVESLSAMPGSHPPWSQTPYMLLHSICTSKNWELTVRQESAARIGAESSIVATVNINEESAEGQSHSAIGKNQGHLEALLLAASGVLEILLKQHMISGKDAITAVGNAHSSILNGSVPVVVGNSLQFGGAPAPAQCAIPYSKSMQKHRPPVPHSNRNSYLATKRQGESVTCEEAVSPHPGVGVRAAPGVCSLTPELVQVTPEPGTDPVTLGPKRASKTTVSPPVYHPPMRTGTSAVNVSAKASISNTARPVGLKALKEQQKEIERNMKKESVMLATLAKRSRRVPNSNVIPLKGLPVPSGTRTTFEGEGHSVTDRRDTLRGMPMAQGEHIRFED